MLATPIRFYGKVVDQFGQPVANAEVQLSAIDRFDADGSRYVYHADPAGYFEVSGVNGALLLVSTSKDGYYKSEGISGGTFAYGVNPDPRRRRPPTRENPAVFTLRKMGTTEPITFVDFGQIEVPNDGRAVLLDLGQKVGGESNFCVQSWVGDSNKRDFFWFCYLGVPGGGLVKRADRFAFEAPESGYSSVMESMSSAENGRWQPEVHSGYFVRLGDGRFGRIDVAFYPGHFSRIVVKSYVNPKVGSRNLEYDPKMAVKD